MIGDLVRMAAPLALLLAAACGARPAPPPSPGAAYPMEPRLQAALEPVRGARVLFSHHSVGRNILSGIAALDGEAGGPRLRVVEGEAWAKVEGPVLGHVSGGRNTDPRSKIDFFAATVRATGRGAAAPRLAFMKLCYVDFNPRTDVDGLFQAYRATLEALKRELPEVRFGHVTVPLHRRPDDLRSSLRRLTGREVWEDAANVKRADFNRRLREAFPGDPVFDLAAVESAGPGGAPAVFESGGRSYPALHPAFTEDGGHLNALGERAAGKAAIEFIASALAR